MNLELLTPFFDRIQKACLPGIWSKGMTFVRTFAVIQDSAQEDEVAFRIRVPDRPVSPKVVLWPNDEDIYCDCNDRNEVCAHVAAVIITLKAGHFQSARPAYMKAGCLSYRFSRRDGKLFFERFLINPDQKDELLNGSLVSFVGGINSGRIKFSKITATKEDYLVDSVLVDKTRGELDRVTLQVLFKALSCCSNVQLDGQPIQVSSKPIQIRAKFTREGAGYRLKQDEDSSITEVFSNGAVLCGTLLRGIDVPSLTGEEKSLLSGTGTFFSERDLPVVLTEILPVLKKKMYVDVLVSRLPQVREVAPRIVLQLEKRSLTETLFVLPVLVYGDEGDPGNHNEILITDRAAEKMLIRKLKDELQLIPGHTVEFTGENAVDFVLRLKGWEYNGNGVQSFSLSPSLFPYVELQNGDFNFCFNTGLNGEKADPNQVLRAWRENRNYVPLLAGGWARLPQDWLSRYGDRISDLIAAKNEKGSLPGYFLPEIVQLCGDLDQPCPDALKNINQLLIDGEGIREAELPIDLKVNLRTYQKKGVNWLCFLRDRKMGAMLADDMGLGKTLQALCAIRGKTLIVCPTSVLYSWAEQMKQFRPGLSFSMYYGSTRKLDESSQVVLTSYALLRLDREVLTHTEWGTVVLDEAQTIKNPDSQIAKVVCSLRADFRLALSGTPLENRLEDLWSQFHFINPGLLGSLSTFQEQFALPMSGGDEEAAKKLKQRVRPFILRRLKYEVAPELPPKTEKVLYCELSSQEQDVYDSILASTRKEVLAKLGAGGGVFAALELLLRLRQACCHMSLVPGQLGAQSAKIELLLQSLDCSISAGHRALVFSQWTSFLDLIEPNLVSRGFTYSRLDGATKNRGQLVEQFQADMGPKIMLISLKAGGVGLTLTAADHIFFMDPWWNPAVEDQAADRSHRIGQFNPVLIHRIVAKGTIEERILDLQKSKLAMAAAVLKDSGLASSMTREDIFKLLDI